MTEVALNSDRSGMSGGRKSKRMANITATLPVQLLDKIDELVDDEKVPSRSYVIREAVRRYIKGFER